MDKIAYCPQSVTYKKVVLSVHFCVTGLHIHYFVVKKNYPLPLEKLNILPSKEGLWDFMQVSW